MLYAPPPLMDIFPSVILNFACFTSRLSSGFLLLLILSDSSALHVLLSSRLFPRVSRLFC